MFTQEAGVVHMVVDLSRAIVMDEPCKKMDLYQRSRHRELVGRVLVSLRRWNSIDELLVDDATKPLSDHELMIRALSFLRMVFLYCSSFCALSYSQCSLRSQNDMDKFTAFSLALHRRSSQVARWRLFTVLLRLPAAYSNPTDVKNSYALLKETIQVLRKDPRCACFT